MLFKNIFKQLIVDFAQKKFSIFYPRTYNFPEIIGKAITLVGPRRCGKTFLLYLQIEKLIKKGIPKSNILYINFEDNRLNGVTLNDLEQLLTAYFELFPNHKEKTTYMFLDEIQEVNSWEKFVRRILDNENMHLFLTGSSAKIFGSDISTVLI